MMSSFFQMHSHSGSGSLPSNTIANPREVKRETKATKDKVQTTNLGSIVHVQPLVVQVPIPEPDVAPKPNPKLLHFDLSFADALLHMPKFASTFKSLLSNKEKLFELANTSLNENCSAALLKKLPEKLKDLGKFLIPCDFSELEECLALADLGASINLMHLSVWKKLSLSELTPTCMILELTNQSVAYPIGVAEDVFRKVRKFHFAADFVIVDYDVDPRVLRFLDSSKSVSPTLSSDPIITTSSPSLTPFEGGDFILEETEACLTSNSITSGIDDADFDSERDILLLKKLLNDDPSYPLPLKEIHFEELKIIKSSIDDPLELELKDLPSHLEYAFLEGTNTLPIIISKELKDEEKAALLKVLKSHKRAIAWKISDIKRIVPRFCTHKILMKDDFKPAVQHQRRVNSKIHEVIKKEVIKLLDAELIYPIFSSPWIPINPQDQEKTTFTCPYGMFAYRRMPFGLCNASCTFQRCMMAIFHDMIEDTMEDLPFKIMYDASDFSMGAVLGKQKELLAVVYPFEKFRSYLVFSKTIVYMDHSALIYLLAKQDAKPRLLWWILLLQEFDVIIHDKKGAENLTTYHLSRLENPHQSDLEKKEINETIPLETLRIISFHGNSSTPWFADIANYHAGNFVVKGMSSQQ
nr:reverse transcriptase domain-containing protein, chloroplastic [Tanacetum cinerariifolium]